MAVEVRELVIMATVARDEDNSPGRPSKSGSNNDVSPNEEMIATCVEKILEILKAKNDR